MTIAGRFLTPELKADLPKLDKLLADIRERIANLPAGSEELWYWYGTLETLLHELADTREVSHDGL